MLLQLESRLVGKTKKWCRVHGVCCRARTRARVCVCVRVCVRACARVCVRARACARTRACMRTVPTYPDTTTCKHRHNAKYATPDIEYVFFMAGLRRY